MGNFIQRPSFNADKTSNPLNGNGGNYINRGATGRPLSIGKNYITKGAVVRHPLGDTGKPSTPRCGKGYFWRP